MNGELRITSLHLVVDLKTTSMVSCFQNGETTADRPKWMLYIWFQGAADVMSIEIVDPEIYKEVAEAIDGIGSVRTLDTAWKNDLFIEICQYLRDDKEWVTDSLYATVQAIAKACMMTHKPKTDILNDLKKQLGCLNLTPGLSAGLLAKIK